MSDYITSPDNDNSESRTDTEVVKRLMAFCAAYGYGVYYRDVNDWIAFKMGGSFRTAWPTRSDAYIACINLIIMDKIAAVRNE